MLMDEEARSIIRSLLEPPFIEFGRWQRTGSAADAAALDDWDAKVRAAIEALYGPPQLREPCTGDPCVCTNGIGCFTVPVEEW